MVKKPYPPGPKAKGRPRTLSEYGKELKEKQKLKNWYNLEEKQLQNYVKKVLKARSKVIDAESALVRKLESRLDNIVYRLGLASSRRAARQLVSHGHFLVNKKPANIPSYEIKKGDKIMLRPKAAKTAFFQKIIPGLKKNKPPSWLKLNANTLEAEVIGEPNLEEAGLPAELSSIFEFYSQ